MTSYITLLCRDEADSKEQIQTVCEYCFRQKVYVNPENVGYNGYSRIKNDIIKLVPACMDCAAKQIALPSLPPMAAWRQ